MLVYDRIFSEILADPLILSAESLWNVDWKFVGV